MWSQVGLRKNHCEQSYWRWWNSHWAISNPKRWCCESAALSMPASLENSAVATGLEKVSFHSNPKERQCQRMLKFSSITQLCPTLCDPMNRSTPGLPVHHLHSDSHALSQWCHPAISSSVVPFSWPLSLPGSESFPMSQYFAWGGQSTGVSALASFLPKKSQGWSSLEWTGWISLQSKGLSRVFSNTIVQKHQFFSAQLSSQSNAHIHTCPLEKP